MSSPPIIVTCALLLCSTALAEVNTSNSRQVDAMIAEKNANRCGNQHYNGNFVGGEDIATAVVIPGLPFSDTGNTCGFIDDYDEVCPYFGSASGDVVYAFTPGANVTVKINLCASAYDTKVYVYENAATPGSPFACNDDGGCGTNFQSYIPAAELTVGNTYYIVIDGWASDCGNYDLFISEVVQPPPCGSCPAGAQIEGEPVCTDNYIDDYNGGCNSLGFTPVNCSTICGETGTYTARTPDGTALIEYRDTDWYSFTLGAGETLRYSGLADGYELQMFITDTLCPSPTILTSTATASCVLSPEISVTGPGTFYLLVGPEAFNGVPCGSTYTLFIDAPGVPNCDAPISVQAASWGEIKSRYQ